MRAHEGTWATLSASSPVLIPLIWLSWLSGWLILLVNRFVSSADWHCWTPESLKVSTGVKALTPLSQLVLSGLVTEKSIVYVPQEMFTLWFEARVAFLCLYAFLLLRLRSNCFSVFVLVLGVWVTGIDGVLIALNLHIQGLMSHTSMKAQLF